MSLTLYRLSQWAKSPRPYLMAIGFEWRQQRVDVRFAAALADAQLHQRAIHGVSPPTGRRAPADAVEFINSKENLDGKLAAGLEPGCSHDYLLLWEVTAGPPSRSRS